ncbi:MAG: TAXI family TRAP transporter solute-binding subunit [Alphaproteobacteria bacterium]|nr:TAXI family TRAP transporter solute-binding subunit [Alphaproteobacteria bacterium]
MDRLRAAVAGIVTLALTGAPALAQRQSFAIATGSTAGTYFPMGELIAGIVSHPQGLDRCDTRAVCGPPGLIVSARTSDGAVSNLLEVNAGLIDSALAEGNVVADAVAGRGAFRHVGKQGHVRVIADLFPEEMQLVAAAGSHIASVGDLGGKRVSLGNPGSGAQILAEQILSAYGVRVKIVRADYEASAKALGNRTLDAFFFLGGTPAPLVRDLLLRGAHLVPLDGKGRARLLRRIPSLASDTIAAGDYRGVGAVATISCRSLWIVSDAVPADTVYGLVRALYHPANRAALAAGPPAALHIRLDEAASGLTAPLHPGAERFYREAGRLPAIR